MIYKVITEENFKEWFRQHDEKRYSDEALEVLYAWLNGDEDIEFDGVEIACTFSEYDSFESFQADGNQNIETLEELENKTTVLKTSSSIIVYNY